MKKEDIKQKIEQFANGLDANDAKYVVIVDDPKDDDLRYIFLNGNKVILIDMMFDAFRTMAKDTDMPLAGLFRLMAAMVEAGENYGC